MDRRVTLDVSRMSVTADGVSDFVWPVAREELVAVRDRLTGCFVPEIRRAAADDRAARVLGTLYGHFLGEALAVYKAQAIVRRLGQRGIAPDIPPASRLLGAMLEGRAPAPSPIVRMLEAGVAPAPAWRRAGRLAKRFLTNDRIVRARPDGLDLERDIVTVALGDMIEQHAAALDERVNYLRFEAWFHPLGADAPAMGRGAPGEGLRDSVMDMMAEAFAAGDEPLLDHSARYLRNWMQRAGSLAGLYIDRLLSRPSRVPLRLWRGTGGHVWSRLLSHASRELGGHVTGHDHAHGQGAWVSYSDTVIEHPGCDRFMVWTGTQRDMSLRNLRPDLTLQDRPPEIAVVPGRFRPKIPLDGGAARQAKRGGGAPTVMYVGTLYNDEFAPFTPLVPGIVLVDWEARLLGRLRAWGYDVLVKPHPESRSPPPRGYSQVLGAKVLTGPFEQVYRQADIVLFGLPNCTPFFGAVATSVPIVIADTGVHRWRPEARRLVERRCAIAPGGADGENRIGMDWDAVRQALEAAPSLKDDAFCREFLYG